MFCGDLERGMPRVIVGVAGERICYIVSANEADFFCRSCKALAVELRAALSPYALAPNLVSSRHATPLCEVKHMFRLEQALPTIILILTYSRIPKSTQILQSLFKSQ
jgi:hypothetical protein